MNKSIENPYTEVKENSSLKLVTKNSKSNQEFDSNSNSCQESLLEIKSANEWIKEAALEPDPKMLFDNLWYEGEICFFFADTNVGKSILAVQIADSITKGIPILGFKLEAKRQTVIYCDFELTKKQFQMRYTNDENEFYKFDDNFFRSAINFRKKIPKEFKTFESFVIHSLEAAITSLSTKILIIDNLTYLGSDIERAKDATPLMQELDILKQKYNLSLLILGHIPKITPSKPITKNNLAGSKMLMNFCDSSFTLGESSKGDDIRFIKPIKVRNEKKHLRGEDVSVVAITKEDNFLHFDYIGPGFENDHLKVVDKKKLNNDIIKAKENNPQLSLGEIAKKVGTYKMNVTRILKANGFDTSA